MICTRCGTMQRRETAKFCHQCGATIEPALTDVQPDSAEIPTLQSTLQQAQTFKPVTLLPPEYAGGDASETQLEEAMPPVLPNPVDDKPLEIEQDAGEAMLKPLPFIPSGQTAASTSQDPPQPLVENPERYEAPPAFPYEQQTEPLPLRIKRQERSNREFASESVRSPAGRSPRDTPPQASPWPSARSATEIQREVISATRWTDTAASEIDRRPARSPQQASVAYPEYEAAASPLRNRPLPAPHNRQTSPTRAALEGQAETPTTGPAPTPLTERPAWSTARGPIPGSLSRSQHIKRRRVPLGVIITLGLLVVFIGAGIGIYTIATSSGGQEPSALLPYSDPGHHFSIKYPNVWLVKQLPNGVRFTDVTDTAELWVTYTTASPNLTVAQFADQEAASVGIATPAPDTDTFAGATWVVRSGVVTHTSGISQQILLYVTLHKNLFFEVRKVAPLNSYSGPNQVAFMPMLQWLELM